MSYWAALYGQQGQGGGYLHGLHFPLSSAAHQDQQRHHEQQRQHPEEGETAG